MSSLYNQRGRMIIGFFKNSLVAMGDCFQGFEPATPAGN